LKSKVLSSASKTIVIPFRKSREANRLERGDGWFMLVHMAD